MKVRLEIRLNPDILDPQGDAINNALQQMNFKSVSSVRQGKLIELDVKASNQEEAHNLVKKMAEELLVNPIMETYTISME
ncbi:MAG: phosphoribosylformylglycinamidine synthase subunit PurS [Paracoccaceae bacterium]|jgi:phosphoribosylformylglycinamidine synthase|tara:strand:+ start:149 stop:388 length:240 start_codon:yes stop_codon:yes gene_type:complete